MKLRHKFNEGGVIVEDELGEELLKSGLWKEVKKTTSRKTAPKQAAPEEG